MHFIHEDIRAEYERWSKAIGSEDPFETNETVGVHKVLKAHFLLIDFFADTAEGIGGVGPKSVELLESAVARQVVSYAGISKYNDLYERCATLMFGLIKNHPFHDANKRTALLVAISFLWDAGRAVTLPQRNLDSFVVAIADSKLNKYFASYPKGQKKLIPNFWSRNKDQEVDQIADFLRRNTRNIELRTPTITFQLLDQVLRRHGFEMGDSYKNCIDILRIEPARDGFFRRVPEKKVRIGQIGFPSWKTQVPKGTIKQLRQMTGLTVENGFDSKVIFEHHEPLNSLIVDYAEPLRRLASK